MSEFPVRKENTTSSNLFIKNFGRPSIELLDVVDEMERFAKERN